MCLGEWIPAQDISPPPERAPPGKRERKKERKRGERTLTGELMNSPELCVCAPTTENQGANGFSTRSSPTCLAPFSSSLHLVLLLSPSLSSLYLNIVPSAYSCRTICQAKYINPSIPLSLCHSFFLSLHSTAVTAAADI